MNIFLVFLSLWLLYYFNQSMIVTYINTILLNPQISDLLPFITIFIITLIIMIINAIDNFNVKCQSSNSSKVLSKLKQKFGEISNVKVIMVGLISAICACIFYYLCFIFPDLLQPALYFSVRPYMTQLAQGFYTSLGAIYGYWLAKLFLPLSATC